MAALFYIFWHWPRRGVDVAEYVGKLTAFREELEAHLGGVLQNETATYKSAAVPPWLAGAGEEDTVFSDWYTMGSAAVLDNINEGAVVSEVKPSHDAIAALYGGGAGSLYDWKLGSPFDPAFVTFTHWFAKPAGMTYQKLFDLLNATLSDDVQWALLRRRMVLGPSPEFCLASEALFELPEPIAAWTLQLKRI